MIDSNEITDFLIEAADTLVHDFDVVDFAHTVTERAARVSGAPAVGLMLANHKSQLEYMAASNSDGKLLELIQLGADEGPCPDCYRSHKPVVNSDLTAADVPWPTFAPQAVAAGFTSVHAFPLRLREEAIGAMSIFGDQTSRFTDDEVAVVQALADVATIGILQERAIHRAGMLADQLQGALDSRVKIEQAKGVLAAFADISVDEAFLLLRAQARRSGRKLLDVSTAVVEDPQMRAFLGS